MKIRLRFTIATIVAVMAYPALAGAAEGAEAGGTWSALIFYIINFGLFLWLIKRFGGPQIVDFFKTRARTIRENVSHAETAFKDAQELERRATQLIAGLAAEKAKIAQDMTEETAYHVKEINKLAAEAVERIKRDGALSVAAAREGGQRRLREALALAAGRMARALVEREFQPADQRRLINGFVAKLSTEARN